VDLRHPPFPQLLARREKAGSDLADLASRGDDEHDPMALIGGPGHDAAGCDRLVVGMSVKAHKGRHPSILAPARSEQ
jgi:hypothetical protein